jgi:N-acetylmuramoyl-L-alanine amidase
MIGLLLAILGAAPAPTAVTIASVRGEQRVDVLTAPDGAPVLAARTLMTALGGTYKQQEAWLDVFVARQQVRFLLGTPVYVFNGRMALMVAPAYSLRDTVYLPLQLVSDILPRLFSERYRYDPETGRLMDAGWQLVKGTGEPAIDVPARNPRIRPPRSDGSLRREHLITIDPGHGGDDPGNPGMFFPRGVREKHVTLQIGRLLRDELERRGIRVRMTRTTDVRPGIFTRAPMCDAACDLFVSLHVDALDPRARSDYRSVSGFHTLIIGEENTEDADRVASLENEALRFETVADQERAESALDFILKDLQVNEFLRESERAGALIQSHMAEVHTGVNRGVRQSNRLAVLNTARRPAVLVEMGYSTNPGDARVMTDRVAQRQLAASIADALVEYLADYERKTDTGTGGDS